MSSIAIIILFLAISFLFYWLFTQLSYSNSINNNNSHDLMPEIIIELDNSKNKIIKRLEKSGIAVDTFITICDKIKQN